MQHPSSTIERPGWHAALKEQIAAAQGRYQVQADRRRLLAPDFKVGDQAYVKAEHIRSTRPTKKLSEKFLGPFTIIARPGSHSFTLRLPDSMRAVHPVFHVSKLRPYIANDDDRFPRREAKRFYDFGNDPEAEWVVSSIDDHAWIKSPPHWEFRVQWEDGDTTWEPLSTVNKLAAMDGYLELMGVKVPSKLPKKEPKGD